MTVVAVLLAAAPLGAQQRATATPRPEVPAIITRGFEAYRTGGLGAAVDVWLVGSPVAGDGSAKAQIVGALAPLEGPLGRMVGADVVDVVEVGPHVRRVYAVVRLERGPLYGFFECYQRVDGVWIIPTVLFNTKAQEILPARYLGG